jgi:hypothetical protein
MDHSLMCPQVLSPGEKPSSSVNVNLEIFFGSPTGSVLYIRQIMENVKDQNPVVHCTAVFRSAEQVAGLQGAILCALKKLKTRQLNLIIEESDVKAPWGPIFTLGGFLARDDIKEGDGKFYEVTDPVYSDLVLQVKCA